MKKNFFEINIKILKISGLWVPTENNNRIKKYCIMTFNTIFVFYSMVYFTIAEFIALKESSANINDLVKNLNMSMSFLLTFCKISVWFIHRNEILNIMDTLSDTAYIFDSIKDFNVERIVREEKKVKDALTYCFFVLACMVPTSACVLTFYELFTGAKYNVGYNETTIGVYKLPYHSYVPFDYKSSQVGYSIAVVYQCFALLSCGTITVGFDMLYTSLVSFTSAHLKILQGAFKTIRTRCIRKLKIQDEDLLHDTDALSHAMELEMGKCVRHLQIIVGICESLERIFTYLILLQVLISLLVFCTCLYIVSSIPAGTNIFGNELAYLLAIENQLALYCYAGNKLTLRGEGIPFSIYDGDWLASTTKFKKNMILTMMRMNKPIHLTAGKFSALTLSTFVTIGRGSYSLLAVLKNS